MNKMKQMILNNIFPISGGTAGALVSTTFNGTSELISQLPQPGAILATVIIGAIGAITGYLTGKLCKYVERLWKRHRSKDKVEYR